MAVKPRNSREVLLRAEAVIETLEFCREKTGNPELGKDVEARIIDSINGYTADQTLLDDLDKDFSKRLNKITEDNT